MMDGRVSVLRPFNSISVISRRWKGEHERLCAMKRRLGSGRISPPAGFKPATPWSEVGSANRSATRTLLSPHEKTNKMACAPSEDTDQPGRIWSAWASAQSDQSLRCPHEETLGPQLPIDGCPGWSEYLLGAQAIVLVLSWGGSIIIIMLGPGHAKMCLMAYANNKGADQPTHPRSLISTIVVRCWDSMIYILAVSQVSTF